MGAARSHQLRRFTVNSTPYVRFDVSSGQVERLNSASRHVPICSATPRLQARQRWPRHARDTGLSWSSHYSEYDALYRAGAAEVRGILSRLMTISTAKISRAGECQRG
jgi:hypothetical protein